MLMEQNRRRAFQSKTIEPPPTMKCLSTDSNIVQYRNHHQTNTQSWILDGTRDSYDHPKTFFCSIDKYIHYNSYVCIYYHLFHIRVHCQGSSGQWHRDVLQSIGSLSLRLYIFCFYFIFFLQKCSSYSTNDELFRRTWVRFLGRTILGQALLTSQQNFGLAGPLSLRIGGQTPKLKCSRQVKHPLLECKNRSKVSTRPAN